MHILLTKVFRRRRVIGISGSLIWLKILMELIFNPCGEFRWSPEGPVSHIHSPYHHAGVPGIFSDLLSSVQMLKRDSGAESNGKLQHLFIPSKTATLVPEFTVEDLSLGRTLMILKTAMTAPFDNSTSRLRIVPYFSRRFAHLDKNYFLNYKSPVSWLPTLSLVRSLHNNVDITLLEP